MRAPKGTPFGTSKGTPSRSRDHRSLPVAMVLVLLYYILYYYSSSSAKCSGCACAHFRFREGLFRSREFRYFLRALSACIIIHSCHLIEFTVAGACLKDYTRFNMTFQCSIFNISMYVENFFCRIRNMKMGS